MLKELYNEWPDPHLYPDFVGDPLRVLDCGFGTAAWACDMARYDPESKVGGISLAVTDLETDGVRSVRWTSHPTWPPMSAYPT